MNLYLIWQKGDMNSLLPDLRRICDHYADQVRMGADLFGRDTARVMAKAFNHATDVFINDMAAIYVRLEAMEKELKQEKEIAS